MSKQSVKRGLVALKEQSVTLRNRMEAEKNPRTKRIWRFRLKSAKFWERLTEGLIFVLLLLILSSCQTFKGATGDTAWMLQKLSDNVQVDKDK